MKPHTETLTRSMFGVCRVCVHSQKRVRLDPNMPHAVNKKRRDHDHVRTCEVEP